MIARSVLIRRSCSFEESKYRMKLRRDSDRLSVHDFPQPYRKENETFLMCQTSLKRAQMSVNIPQCIENTENLKVGSKIFEKDSYQISQDKKIKNSIKVFPPHHFFPGKSSLYPSNL